MPTEPAPKRARLEEPARRFRSPPPFAKRGDPIQALPPGLRLAIFEFLWRPRAGAELIQAAAARAVADAPEASPDDAWQRFCVHLLWGDSYAQWVMHSAATRAVGWELIRVGGLDLGHALYSHPLQGVVAIASTVLLPPLRNRRWMPWTGPLSAEQSNRDRQFEHHRDRVVARWKLRRDGWEARLFILTPPLSPTSWDGCCELHRRETAAWKLADTTHDPTLKAAAAAWARRAGALADDWFHRMELAAEQARLCALGV